MGSPRHNSSHQPVRSVSHKPATSCGCPYCTNSFGKYLISISGTSYCSCFPVTTGVWAKIQETNFDGTYCLPFNGIDGIQCVWKLANAFTATIEYYSDSGCTTIIGSEVLSFTIDFLIVSVFGTGQKVLRIYSFSSTSYPTIQSYAFLNSDTFTINSDCPDGDSYTSTGTTGCGSNQVPSVSFTAVALNTSGTATLAGDGC